MVPKHTTSVLIVDDRAEARKALKSVLAQDGYDLMEASNGVEGLSLAKQTRPDVVLLDVMMPEMDGNEVCRAIREDGDLAAVPVVMITGLDDKESKLQATWSGADDFITKPFDREEVRARVRMITRLNRYRLLVEERERVDRLITLSPDGIVLLEETGDIRFANPRTYVMLGLDSSDESLIGTPIWNWTDPTLKERFASDLQELLLGGKDRLWIETRLRTEKGGSLPVEITAGRFPLDDGHGVQFVLHDVTERYEQLDVIRGLNSDLLIAYDATLEGWVAALDIRHEETKGHTRRVTAMMVHFAAAYGFDTEDLDHVRRGALLHDIGKIAIPDRILLKSSSLSEDEWVVMRQHPTNAYDWLSPIDFLKRAIDIPHYHHEKWDGSGYPSGLVGDQIPLTARMFSLVDVWDALISHRAYRKALPEEEVFEYITSQAGKHFDPDLVHPFVESCKSFTGAGHRNIPCAPIARSSART